MVVVIILFYTLDKVQNKSFFKPKNGGSRGFPLAIYTNILQSVAALDVAHC